MAGFDYDVVIIGSGFGGSVAALRAAEKGYRVGVMESGRRWADEDIPKSQWDLAHFVWFPAAELYGVQRIEYLDDVLVLSGAGVGGGSHVYASTLYVPPKQFFDAKEWAGITDWADELAPYFDQAARMLGVVRYPYMPTDVDRAIKRVANDIGRGETHNKAPLGVFFGTPGVEADDPYFGGVGPRRTGCISCGNCNNGCGHNAKNKLTTNYLYLAEKLGAQVHDMHEVFDLVRLEGGGFEVHARHPGWAQRAGHLHHHTYTAEQVIVAAHAYGSAKLLHHMQHKGRLTGLSSELGKRARTNSEQLLYITRTHAEWERDRERIHIMPGSVTITSGTRVDALVAGAQGWPSVLVALVRPERYRAFDEGRDRERRVHSRAADAFAARPCCEAPDLRGSVRRLLRECVGAGARERQPRGRRSQPSRRRLERSEASLS